MIRINGQHLIRRILEGERYFVGMILEDNFNLNASPDFAELQKYLLKQTLWSEPIIFTGSDIRKLTASGLPRFVYCGSSTKFGSMGNIVISHEVMSPKR